MRLFKSAKRRRTLQKRGDRVWWNLEHRCWAWDKKAKAGEQS